MDRRGFFGRVLAAAGAAVAALWPFKAKAASGGHVNIFDQTFFWPEDIARFKRLMEGAKQVSIIGCEFLGVTPDTPIPMPECACAIMYCSINGNRTPNPEHMKHMREWAKSQNAYSGHCLMVDHCGEVPEKIGEYIERQRNI